MKRKNWLEISKDNRSYVELGKLYEINEKTIRRNLKKRGFIKITTSRVGKYNWKKTKFRRKHSDGYILIYKPEHPVADIHGEVLEHRLIMEKKIGRYLTRTEVVHHKNEIKDDNKIENLQLLRNCSEHIKLHNPKITTWSLKHNYCIRCKKNNRKHASKGLCVNCNAQKIRDSLI